MSTANEIVSGFGTAPTLDHALLVDVPQTGLVHVAIVGSDGVYRDVRAPNPAPGDPETVRTILRCVFILAMNANIDPVAVLTDAEGVVASVAPRYARAYSAIIAAIGPWQVLPPDNFWARRRQRMASKAAAAFQDPTGYFGPSATAP